MRPAAVARGGRLLTGFWTVPLLAAPGRRLRALASGCADAGGPGRDGRAHPLVVVLATLARRRDRPRARMAPIGRWPGGRGTMAPRRRARRAGPRALRRAVAAGRSRDGQLLAGARARRPWLPPVTALEPSRRGRAPLAPALAVAVATLVAVALSLAGHGRRSRLGRGPARGRPTPRPERGLRLPALWATLRYRAWRPRAASCARALLLVYGVGVVAPATRTSPRSRRWPPAVPSSTAPSRTPSPVARARLSRHAGRRRDHRTGRADSTGARCSGASRSTAWTRPRSTEYARRLGVSVVVGTG